MGFVGLSMDATKVLAQIAGLPNIKLAPRRTRSEVAR